MKFYLRIVLIFHCAVVTGQSENWVVTGITDSVLQITQRDDEIWVATQHQGIQAFNKSTGEISAFNSVNSDLKTDGFKSIECIENKIYAGSYLSGFFIYENGYWIQFDTINSDLPGNEVSDFLYDAENENIWIATDLGLVNIHNDIWTIYDTSNSEIAGNQLTCLFLDSSGNLWIGTRTAGMSKFNGGIFTTYDYSNSGLNDNWVKSIAEDASGILYIADYFGVDKYDPINDVWLFVYNLFTAPLSSDRVNKVMFDHDQNMWFATHHGITKWNMEDEWNQYYTDNTPLPHNTSDDVFTDSDGIVWIATFGGLAAYKPSSFTFPSFQNELIIYPNPANQNVGIFVNDANTILITDITGQTVIEYLIDADIIGQVDVHADIHLLLPGIYFVIAKNEDTFVVERLMVK